MHWNIENIFMIVIKHLEMKQLLVVNYPLQVYMPLNNLLGITYLFDTMS